MTSKQLWVLAGANGAGKSTYFIKFLAPRGLRLVNADLLAKIISPESPEEHSYQAAAQTELLRRKLLDDGVTFCFETVFSHPSKIDFVAEAKARGYQVVLVYIHLKLPQLNAARVAQRREEGGHSVPEEKIFSRIPRTLDNIKKALPLADQAFLVDNSSAEDPYLLVATMKDGAVIYVKDEAPAWVVELLASPTGPG